MKFAPPNLKTFDLYTNDAFVIHLLTQFLCQLSSRMNSENPEGTQVIVGSMNMGYFRRCQESNSQPVPFQVGADPVGHSDDGLTT